LKKQVGASDVANNIPALYRVLNKNTDMAAGGDGEISTRLVIDYMRLALSLKGNGLYQVDLDGPIGVGPGGASIVEADPARIEAAVDAFVDPDVEARETAADQVAGTSSGSGTTDSANESAVDPATVSVDVRNGSGTEGAARSTADALGALGYQVVVRDGAGANADRFDYAQTTVEYRADAAKDAAQAVADSFDQARVRKATGANTFDTKVLVIVGASGEVSGAGTTSGGPTADSNAVPEKQAPQVIKDGEYGRDTYAAAIAESGPQLAAKAKLVFPAVREENSTWDEMRIYEIPKGSARYASFRVVGETGSGDFWGVQGTTWPDPPLLSDPTREVTKGGRTYQLFFNGTKLHMVAWRENGAVYWVTNSVLNKLSNETMLAIAQGAVPYRA
jgi:LytR cell envelope-related transcriptional attenuator